MSREAQVWVASLPLDLGAGINLAAFRVLDKLADAHHTDSDHAYRDVPKLADELGCSVRTVQRALRELEKRGLIVVGDQRVLPRTIPGNRAPTAYRLPWRGLPVQPALPGVTTVVTAAAPVDNSARGDRHAVSGVTTVVAHRTQEQRELTTSPAIDRAGMSSRSALSAPLRGACSVTGDDHEVSRSRGVCVYCGYRPERKRT